MSGIFSAFRKIFGMEGQEAPLTGNSLEDIIDFIKSKKCKNIITMGGAGISTSAGIPDFRSKDCGLYKKLEPYNLPYPEAIFTLDYFDKNPEPFFVFIKSLFSIKYKPTPTHQFIRLLNEKNILLRHYTQNVDTLERLSGLPKDRMVEAHGTFNTGHCRKCKKEYSFDWLKDNILENTVPFCDNKKCKGVVKPDVVLFGEGLPVNFFLKLFTDFKRCDLLIIMGTSLMVQPFASLADRVSNSTPRLYINKEVPPSSFKYKNSMRDVFWQGNCDEACQIMAQKLDWANEFKKLVDSSLTFVLVKNRPIKDSIFKDDPDKKIEQ